MRIEIPSFEKARIIVVGDVMLDCYWHGDTNRISPEAPVPVVHVKDIQERVGGAGNVALNISAIGSEVKLFGVVGDDDAGKSIDAQLKAAKVEPFLTKQSNHPTIRKLRVVGRHQQLIRLDFEENLSQTDYEPMLIEYQKHLANTDIVVLSDYHKGTLTQSQQFIQLAKARNIPILVDPKNIDLDVYRGATIVTPNYCEFEAVVGHCQSESEIEAKARALLCKHDFKALLITRGKDGMSLIRSGQPAIHLPTKAQDVYDVTGAGDTVIAILAAALAVGEDLSQAIIFANAAAGVVVRKFGASTVSIAELRRAMQRLQDPWAAILDEDLLLQQVQDAKAHGEKIVMTNGCFDILHSGHVTYLEKAKDLGKRLVIAVNDDDSVRRLKGADRPINNVEQRMLVLAALRAVDWVVKFSEDTPERLIKKISPDILVKGGDYRVDQIAGATHVLNSGGEVVIVPFEDGFSTTSMLKRIRGDQK